MFHSSADSPALVVILVVQITASCTESVYEDLHELLELLGHVIEHLRQEQSAGPDSLPLAQRLQDLHNRFLQAANLAIERAAEVLDGHTTSMKIIDEVVIKGSKEECVGESKMEVVVEVEDTPEGGKIREPVITPHEVLVKDKRALLEESQSEIEDGEVVFVKRGQDQDIPPPTAVSSPNGEKAGGNIVMDRPPIQEGGGGQPKRVEGADNHQLSKKASEAGVGNGAESSGDEGEEEDEASVMVIVNGEPTKGSASANGTIQLEQNATCTKKVDEKRRSVLKGRVKGEVREEE